MPESARRSSSRAQFLWAVALRYLQAWRGVVALFQRAVQKLAIQGVQEGRVRDVALAAARAV